MELRRILNQISYKHADVLVFAPLVASHLIWEEHLSNILLYPRFLCKCYHFLFAVARRKAECQHLVVSAVDK